MRIDHQAHRPENTKVGHKGLGLGHVTYFFNVHTCTISVEWLKNFKVGAQIDHKGYYPKVGAWSRDLLLNFGFPSISLEWVK